jgi:SAM-dependent methyltransferase
MDASDYNRQTYDRIWDGLSDFIRYNPGARHRRRFTLRLLDSIRFSSLLDVGCGNAELLCLLQDRYPHARLAGVDLSDAVVEANAKRIPGMRFSACDIQRGALQERFDAIVCSEVIEHLDDREAAFANLAAMLKPGGHVVLTCPTGKVFETERFFGHTTHPSPEEIEERGGRHGLEVKALYNWGFPMYRALKWATNVSPEWSLKNFGERSYGKRQVAVSTALYFANFLNLPRSASGCQLFALLEKRR